MFGHDLMAADRCEYYRRMLGDIVVAHLTADRARA
ncbi:hypothetical protein ACWENS_43975 [Streptomyces sp. NPDC004532]